MAMDLGEIPPHVLRRLFLPLTGLVAVVALSLYEHYRSSGLKPPSTAEILDFTRTMANCVTALMAYLGFRLAQDRWGFDKDKHAADKQEKRREFIRSKLHVHKTPESIAEAIASESESEAERLLFMRALRDEVRQLAALSTTTKARLLIIADENSRTILARLMSPPTKP
jgi:hypothetical protein